jgi:hypothetical protein
MSLAFSLFIIVSMACIVLSCKLGKAGSISVSANKLSQFSILALCEDGPSFDKSTILLASFYFLNSINFIGPKKK